MYLSGCVCVCVCLTSSICWPVDRWRDNRRRVLVHEVQEISSSPSRPIAGVALTAYSAVCVGVKKIRSGQVRLGQIRPGEMKSGQIKQDNIKSD